MLRSIVERISRGMVLRRRLPKQFGGDVLYVSPDASLRHWRLDMQKIDPQLFNLLPSIVKPGDVVWDVGANVGIFAFASAALAGSGGHVVAVEPDCWLVSLLQRSAVRSSSERSEVAVLPAAVSDHLGVARFNIAMRGRAASHLAGLGRIESGGSRETTLVMAVTLDWMMNHLPAPNVLKIDVEGAENLVLRGGSQLLDLVRPTIVCEVGRTLIDEVTQIMTTFRYEVIDLDLQDGKPFSDSRAFWNILAKPL